MSTKVPMKDIVVILPGILGSVLQKKGTDLWNVSGQAIWQILKSLGNRVNDLQLEKDDPTGGDIGDGVVATALVQDTHLIPGLCKIDGYTGISEFITKNFEVTLGDIYHDPDDTVANFYHFPYDWRRDNRASANILKKLLDKRLQAWRNSDANRKDAKVILLAHSMGGLVSRYYLEVLGGWRDSRALFTFGTPYRGSVNAVNFVANGYKQLFLDLTDALRSFTSVYQLMPIYEMLKIEDTFYRIAQSPVELPNIIQEKAEDAFHFHQEIQQAVSKNQKETDYSYITVPVVGIEQNTLQSAVFTNGKIEVVEEPPQIIAHRPDLAKGDGTVPEVSAFPPEFTPQQVFIARSVAEKHGSLQNQEWILDDLGQILANYQFDLTKIKGKGRNAGQKAIAVSLEDINFAGEPIVIKARGIGVPSSAQLKAEVTCVSEEKEPLNFDFEAKGQDWELQIQDLSSGLYRITVTAENTGAAPVTPVHDLFEVSNKADYQS